MHFLIYRSFLTEVQFTTQPAPGSETKFLDNPIFSSTQMANDVQVTGIESYYADILPYAPSGLPSISFNGLTRCLITLMVGARDYIYIQPAVSCCTLINSGQLRRLNDLNINYSKCYVKVTENATPTITAGQSLVLNFIYKRKK